MWKVLCIFCRQQIWVLVSGGRFKFIDEHAGAFFSQLLAPFGSLLNISVSIHKLTQVHTILHWPSHYPTPLESTFPVTGH